MKIRNGFVSNSSSSSFIISKEYLSPHQIKQIRNHLEEAKKFQSVNNLPEEYKDHVRMYLRKDGLEEGVPEKDGWYGYSYCDDPNDAWKLEETDTEIKGGTNMTNFDMRAFLEEIGVSKSVVTWGDYWEEDL